MKNKNHKKNFGFCKLAQLNFDFKSKSTAAGVVGATGVPATNADQNHYQTVVPLNDEKHGREDSPLWMPIRLLVN